VTPTCSASSVSVNPHFPRERIEEALVQQLVDRDDDRRAESEREPNLPQPGHLLRTEWVAVVRGAEQTPQEPEHEPGDDRRAEPRERLQEHLRAAGIPHVDGNLWVVGEHETLRQRLKIIPQELRLDRKRVAAERDVPAGLNERDKRADDRHGDGSCADQPSYSASTAATPSATCIAAGASARISTAATAAASKAKPAPIRNARW
jgi:hypothetical protein